MSGISGNISFLTSSCADRLNQTNNDYLGRLRDIWKVIYGLNDVNLSRRLEILEINLEGFWMERIEEMENSKKSLEDSIESLKKQALVLEKELGVESRLSCNIEDTPLADLEEQLWKLLESYNEIKEKRLEEFDECVKKEKDLCLVLNENCQLSDVSKNLMENCATTDPNLQRKIPSEEDIAKATERVTYLEGRKNELNGDFLAAREELRHLLEVFEVHPLSKIERFACHEIEEIDFPCTQNNYDRLFEGVENFRTKKTKAELEANNLRDQVSQLWLKMLKDERDLQEFINDHQGYKKSVILKLGQKLSELQIERKENLKFLILQQRAHLDHLWTECNYSDAQRNEFQAYHSNCFTEKVLEEHEQELARLQHHLNKYRHIYKLAEKYFELWKRMLHLEELAKQSDRLFTNRGGQLLLEEKERKIVQKKLPQIKEDLIKLVGEYRVAEGQDLLFMGSSLLFTLDEMEEERLASKENNKLQRKAANFENIKVDNRLGARPVAAGCKRKILTPKNPNRNEVASQRMRLGSQEDIFAVPYTPSKTPTASSSTKIPTYSSSTKTPTASTPTKTPTASRFTKTPTACTPRNRSPTYESFEEQLAKEL